MVKRKSREDNATESFFSSRTDFKKTTEKVVKEVDPELMREEFLRSTTEKLVKDYEPVNLRTTEKVSSKPEVSELVSIENGGDVKKKRKNSNGKKGKKKSAQKKAKKTTTKDEIYIVPKVLLKKNGYELVITEKPQAALKISSALGVSTKREILKGVPYYEVDRDGKKLIVACAVGHLFTLKQNVPGSNVPIFDISWVPNYLVKKGDFTKKYYDTLLKLAKNAGSITVATDFDVEGEVIGKNVVKLICNQNDANRMKFSTLTNDELNQSYENKSKHLNWEQAIAGESRHYLDWFYGINLSRALMNAIKTTGKFKVMSIGRVQGPALNLVVQREREILDFKKEPYWQVFLTTLNPKLELKCTKDFFNKEEIKKFENLEGKEIELFTKKAEQKVAPNPPFDLTSLQTESYKLYGITPSNTLKATQSLYLAGLISYPRTSSQKLPPSIGYKSILETLKKRYNVEKLITKDKPIEGKKTDPAHPSIYPTGNTQVLSGSEEKIYDLIVKRFLALFCDDAIIDRKRISGEIEGNTFSTSGYHIRKKSWMEFYPVKTNEKELPDVEGKKKIKSVKIEEKETQPPRRYSPASIISELEKRNLGTKATRAAIVETLYDRGYIKEKSIEATPIGMSLIKTLEKYSPIIIDEKLTKKLQDEMDEIVENPSKNLNELKVKGETIIQEAKGQIVEIAKEFSKKENLIGKELVSAQEDQRKIEKEENTLNLCPKCKKNNLRVTYSPKNRRFFVACSGYPECKNTYSLPPYGLIKQTGKNCEKCDFPLLMALQKGKKPWIFCFNSECPTNKERIEEYRKKLEEKENIN
ncbi:MAG: DNA topoisomerase I [Nanoarchaeota archaeon]|nr:DNA topoisomerase I [Nanoarchaeota archaeon]